MPIGHGPFRQLHRVRQGGQASLQEFCGLGVATNQLPNGTVRLAFHGTSEHSIVLTVLQQAALIPLLLLGVADVR